MSSPALPPSDPSPSAAPLRDLALLALGTALVVSAFAMSNPVLAVLLQQRGLGATAVGAFAMVPFAMVALLIPVLPRWLARVGLVRAWRLGLVLELVGALMYATTDRVWIWVLAAVISGAGAAALWNATEALLARHAPPERRGRVMGLYQTALGAALALGPFVPGLLGLSAQGVLWAAVVTVLAATWPALVTRLGDSAASTEATGAAVDHGVGRAMARVPALVLIAFGGGVFEAGLGSVSAAQAAAGGMSLAGAASVVGAIGVGSFVAQYPAGLLADRVRPRHLFGAAGAVLLLASAAYAAATLWSPLLWLAAVGWGGVGGALYTLCMVRVAYVFGPSQSAAGTAAMIVGYTSGGVAGPLLAGLSLDLAGTTGLALLLGTLSLAVMGAARRLA